MRNKPDVPASAASEATATVVLRDALLQLVQNEPARINRVQLERAFRDAMAHVLDGTGAKELDALNAKVQAARLALVSEKQVVPAGDMAARLQITRQALSKAVKAHRMFTVYVSATPMYPAFFADPDLDRRQLERVAKELGELPGWQKWTFFATPKASLGNITPVQALKKGRYSEVRAAAKGFAER